MPLYRAVPQFIMLPKDIKNIRNKKKFITEVHKRCKLTTESMTT